MNVIAIDGYIGWLQTPSSHLTTRITVWYEQLESFVEIPVALIERQYNNTIYLKTNQQMVRFINGRIESEEQHVSILFE